MRLFVPVPNLTDVSPVLVLLCRYYERMSGIRTTRSTGGGGGGGSSNNFSTYERKRKADMSTTATSQSSIVDDTSLFNNNTLPQKSQLSNGTSESSPIFRKKMPNTDFLNDGNGESLDKEVAEITQPPPPKIPASAVAGTDPLPLVCLDLDFLDFL